MEVLFFGIARDIVGRSAMEISELGRVPRSVSELKRSLQSTFPEFGKLSSLAVAVNSEYAEDSVILEQGDEVAIIPPVSGG
ncbi:MAG: MoaD/ThiS family protein, partial [Bacteroidota bacterium]